MPCRDRLQRHVPSEIFGKSRVSRREILQRCNARRLMKFPLKGGDVGYPRTGEDARADCRHESRCRTFPAANASVVHGKTRRRGSCRPGKADRKLFNQGATMATDGILERWSFHSCKGPDGVMFGRESGNAATSSGVQRLDNGVGALSFSGVIANS